MSAVSRSSSVNNSILTRASSLLLVHLEALLFSTLISRTNESFSNSTYCELGDAAFHGCACSFAFLQQYFCCNDPHKGRRLRLIHLQLVYSFLLFPFLSKCRPSTA